MLTTNNKFSYPKRNILYFFLNYILNNKYFIKTKVLLNYPITKTKLKSDIRNVVYYNWMVPKDIVDHLIPEGVLLKRYENKVLLTILNYNHGNFRPSFLNGIKSIFGSPNQSNWRLYIDNEPLGTDKSSVLFISNIMSNFFYSIGSRLFSNALNSHYPLTFNHYQKENTLHTTIDSGYSNSPSLQFESKISDKWLIPYEFKIISKNHIELLEKICFQDFAVTNLNETKLCQTEIKLEFDIKDIKPLSVTNMECLQLNEIIKNSNCFAFMIPSLVFKTINEEIIKK